MSGSDMLATRRFTLADQQDFATLSGDVNPMHLDALAARRTQAGVLVVHGINALLWALDVYCGAEPDARLTDISVRFERFIPVDEEVTLFLRRGSATKLELRLAGTRLMSVTIRSVSKGGATPAIDIDGALVPLPSNPIALDFDDARGGRGVMPLRDCANAYPAVAAQIGSATVSAVAGLSTLVGMVMPGLHSIFSGADLAFAANDHAPGRLSYEVVEAHEVFRLLGIGIAATGVTGKVQAFVRLPPVVQPTALALRSRVDPGAFAGISALVVGGSRGLGEVTAKLLAMGGASVTISYAVGTSDAEAVAAEIRNAGGLCSTMRLDALSPIAPQMAMLPTVADQIYYFATTKIFLQKASVYEPELLHSFQKIYVDAFAEICAYASQNATKTVAAFYPSSIAVEERPRAMTEYTMAKAAAEILCADIDRFLPYVRTVVRRLPRLLTDQTATVTPAETLPVADVMLEAVQAMMRLCDDSNRTEKLQTS